MKRELSTLTMVIPHQTGLTRRFFVFSPECMAYVILHGWLDGLPPVTLQHTSVVSGRSSPVVSSKRFSVASSKKSLKTLINGTGNQRDASQDTLLIHPSLDRLKC